MSSDSLLADGDSVDNESKLDEILDKLQKEQNFEIFESQETTRRKERVIDEIENLLTNWIRRCLSMVKGIPKSDIERSSCCLFPFGSYALNAHFASSDIDLLCVGPKQVERSMLFSADFVQMLQSDHRVTDVLQLQHAFVPLIKFTFGGVDIDLVYAQWDADFVGADDDGNTIDIFSSDYVKTDPHTLYSLNGARATQAIKRLIRNPRVFEKALRIIKFWARQRSIYSNVMGYLGGISWSIMTAKICIEHPDASCVQVIRHFFDTYRHTDVGERVSIDSKLYANLYAPQGTANGAADYHHHHGAYGPRNGFAEEMRILTPAQPELNCAYNVIETTKNVILYELDRAYKLTREDADDEDVYDDDDGEGEGVVKVIDWQKLFLHKHILHSDVCVDDKLVELLHQQYWRQELKYWNEDAYADVMYVRIVSRSSRQFYRKWTGFMESKMRALVKRLSRSPAYCTFCPFANSIQHEQKHNLFIVCRYHKVEYDYVVEQIRDALACFQSQIQSSSVRCEVDMNCDMQWFIHDSYAMPEVLHELGYTAHCAPLSSQSVPPHHFRHHHQARVHHHHHHHHHPATAHCNSTSSQPTSLTALPQIFFPAWNVFPGAAPVWAGVPSVANAAVPPHIGLPCYNYNINIPVHPHQHPHPHAMPPACTDAGAAAGSNQGYRRHRPSQKSGSHDIRSRSNSRKNGRNGNGGGPRSSAASEYHLPPRAQAQDSAAAGAIPRVMPYPYLSVAPFMMNLNMHMNMGLQMNMNMNMNMDMNAGADGAYACHTSTESNHPNSDEQDTVCTSDSQSSSAEVATQNSVSSSHHSSQHAKASSTSSMSSMSSGRASASTSASTSTPSAAVGKGNLMSSFVPPCNSTVIELQPAHPHVAESAASNSSVFANNESHRQQQQQQPSHNASEWIHQIMLQHAQQTNANDIATTTALPCSPLASIPINRPNELNHHRGTAFSFNSLPVVRLPETVVAYSDSSELIGYPSLFDRDDHRRRYQQHANRQPTLVAHPASTLPHETHGRDRFPARLPPSQPSPHLSMGPRTPMLETQHDSKSELRRSYQAYCNILNAFNFKDDPPKAAAVTNKPAYATIIGSVTNRSASQHSMLNKENQAPYTSLR